MSGRTRIALTAVAAALTLAVAAAPAVAGKNGPNNQNAKLCQKGGWQSLYTSTGGTFANQSQCVSYAAKGGTLLTTPPYAGQAICAQFGGTFAIGTTPVVWSCNNLPPPRTGDQLLALFDACVTDGGVGLDFTPIDTTCLRND